MHLPWHSSFGSRVRWSQEEREPDERKVDMAWHPSGTKPHRLTLHQAAVRRTYFLALLFAILSARFSAFDLRGFFLVIFSLC